MRRSFSPQSLLFRGSRDEGKLNIFLGIEDLDSKALNMNHGIQQAKTTLLVAECKHLLDLSTAEEWIGNPEPGVVGNYRVAADAFIQVCCKSFSSFPATKA